MPFIASKREKSEGEYSVEVDGNEMKRDPGLYSKAVLFSCVTEIIIRGWDFKFVGIV